MPRYHSMGTEVQLCTWDPLSCRSISQESFVSEAQTPPTDWHPTASSKSQVPKDGSAFSGCTPFDHDSPRKVKRFVEDYFVGHEGLSFLGCDAPFFLIHAGNESSNVNCCSKPWASTNNSLHQDPMVFDEFPEKLTVTAFSRTSQIPGKVVPATPYIGSAFNESNRDRNDLLEVHSSSSLSSLSSTDFLSPRASDFRSVGPNADVTGRTSGASFVTPGPSKRIADKFGISSRASKLDIETKPVQVVVILSEKSFTNPLLGTESDHCDICINIFYNGEFNTSQIIKYSAWVALGNKYSFNFSGRRIGIGHELPWAIIAGTKGADSIMLQSDKAAEAPTALERWNTLSEMLALEANEWGRDKRGYRYSTGEYLELLSRKAIPCEFDGPQVNMESGFGVIDVVITLGRVVHYDAAKKIGFPCRYLCTSQSVASNFESNINAPPLAGAVESSRALSGPQSFNPLGSSTIELEPQITSGALCTKGISHAIANASPCQGDQRNSGAVEVATPTLEVTNHYVDSPAVLTRAKSMSTSIPVAVAKVPTPRPPHPNRPRNVPQKTYRGSEPILPPPPPSRRQKIANLFEELPFDLNTAAYMSTRARRTASMPFAQTPTKPQEEGSLKRKRSVNQTKSTLSNIEASEALVAGTPFKPGKYKGSEPKTPEFGDPLRKKARTRNFNAKLSNRPQNLRRKNSAGQWIIPPCRRNSAGEWETPTKGGKFETPGDFGGQIDGAAEEESEKMFQPVFTASTDYRTRNIAIGQDTTDQVSPNGDKIALKENIYQHNSAGNANRIGPAVGVIESKKENLPPNGSTGQRNEELFPVTPTKFKILPSKATIRGVRSPHTPVKSSSNQGPPATSPSPPEKPAFKNYFRRTEEDATIVGIDGAASIKHKRRRRTLHMRFFEGNINSDGEVIDDGNGTRRWLARRCTGPACFTGPGSGKQQSTSTFPLSEKSKLNLPILATGPKGEKVTDLLKDSATTRSRRKSQTGDLADLASTNDLAITTPRENILRVPLQPQYPALAQARPRFVIPNHNSRVLKLVNRRPVATVTDPIKQEDQGTNFEVNGFNRTTGGFGGDAANDFDRLDAYESPIVGNHNDHRHSSRHDTKLKASPMLQYGNNESTGPSYEPTMPSARKKGITQSCDSEAQLVQEEDATIQMPAGRKIPKRQFRPRTVGSTELKALLESHDHRNVADTSHSTSLGMMHSRPMTRASRNAIPSKPHKVIGTSGICPDTGFSSHKPIFQRPITGNSALRKRSSSGQFVGGTTNASIVPKDMKIMDGGTSIVVDAQTSSPIHSGASGLETKKTSSGTPKTGTSNQRTVTPVEYGVSFPGAGELPSINILATQTMAVPRLPKILKSRREAVQDLGGKLVEQADKIKTAVEYTNGASIDKPLLLHGKSKDALKTNATNMTSFKEAAEEVDIALKQACGASTEINKTAGDLESLTAPASAQRIIQKKGMSNTDRVEASNDKKVGESVTDMTETEEQNTPLTQVLVPGINTFKPGCLCDDSILTHVKNETWDDLERNPVTGQIFRRVEMQDEGYFMPFGILMGVRYVVVGSAVVKDCKI